MVEIVGNILSFLLVVISLRNNFYHSIHLINPLFYYSENNSIHFKMILECDEKCPSAFTFICSITISKSTKTMIHTHIIQKL